MANEGMWVYDPETNEPTYLLFDDLDSDTLPQLLRPLGGFCYPAGSFLRLPLPEVPYYIKDWLPKMGKACIYAPAKSGKSFLCVQIGRCIGSGRTLVGMPTNQGSVLYLQFELGQEVLQARMKSTGQEYENFFVGTTFSLKLDQEAGQRTIKRVMEAVEPNVLILDPLYKSMAGDENESADMRKVTDFLDTIIEAYQCSILIIHHPGKDLKKGGRGSSVLEDWVDSYIEMRKISSNGDAMRIRLTPKLLRHAELAEPVEGEMVNFEFHPVESEEHPTVKGQIMDTMESNPSEVFAPKIFFEMNLGSNASVHDALKELVRDGFVDRIGQGKYVWKKEEKGG